MSFPNLARLALSTTLYRAPEFQSLDDMSRIQTQPMPCNEVRSAQDLVGSVSCAIVAQKLSSPGNEVAAQSPHTNSSADTVLAVVRQFYPRITAQAEEEIRQVLQDSL